MTDKPKNLLSNLVLISKVDGALARLGAERRKAEAELQDLSLRLKKAETEANTQARQHEEKRRRYVIEENKIRDEREKLVLRRKALSSLGNYKLQQAAEKEIEHAARELDGHEEGLIGLLVEVDNLAEGASSTANLSADLRQKYEALQNDTRDVLKSFEERERAHLDEKAELVTRVDAASLNFYQRVSTKYPVDAVVPLRKGTCGGCFMQVGPQAAVQIGRNDAIVRCRGCGRILFVEEIQDNREESGG